MGVVVGGRRRGEASARAARRDPRLHGCAVWGPTRPWVRVRVRVRVRVGLGLGLGVGGGVRVRVRARVGLGAVVRADGRRSSPREGGAVDRRRRTLWPRCPGGSQPTNSRSAARPRPRPPPHRAPGRQPAPVARQRVGAREGAVSRLRVRPRPFPLRRATAARLACDRCVTGAPTHPHQGHLPLSPSPDPGNSGAPEQPPNRR